MTRPLRRWTVLLLLCALVFQLGAAAAAGLPSQSCCGTCDVVVAHGDALPAQHCATPGERRGHDAPAHRHGNGPCPLCGDHQAALAPFVLFANAALPAVIAPGFVVAFASAALPPPIPHRLERPPAVA